MENGLDDVIIPDHEVVTRRKQFRMKKDLAEQKKKKKQDKKEEKDRKKEEKDKKKAEKAAAAEKKKADKALKQRGRNSKEKAKERQKKQRKAKNAEPDPQAAASASQNDAVRSRKMKRLKKMSSWHKSHEDLAEVDDSAAKKKENGSKKKEPENLPKEKKQKKAVPKESTAKTKTLSKKPTKNKGIATVKQSGERDEEEEPTEMMQQKVHGGEVEEGRIEGDKDKTERKNDAARVEEEEVDDPPVDDAKVEKNRKPKKQKKEEPKKNKSQSKAKTAGKKKGSSTNPVSSSKKRAAKTPGEQPEKKVRRSRASRDSNEGIEKDAAVSDLVLQTLKECKASECTHPSFEKVQAKHSYVQPYWTRNAAGVLVERDLLPNKKAKGKGKAQVVYFSSKTTCCYTNLVIAGLWVSRLQKSHAEGEGAYKGGLGAILSIMIGRYFLSSGVALQFIVWLISFFVYSFEWSVWTVSFHSCTPYKPS